MSTKETNKDILSMSLGGILEPAEAALLVPPFTKTSIPLFGLHLLQASCWEAGIDTRVVYSNLLYAGQIGAELYNKFSSDYHLLLSERIFSAAAFDDPRVSITRAMHKFSDPAWFPDHLWPVEQSGGPSQIPTPVVPYREWLADIDLESLESLTVDWVKVFARQVVNMGFRIVGCSNTLSGLVPSIALLNCIKKADPGVITILGGALCEDEMAEGILSLNTGIDYIFSGEGEISFPVFVKQVQAGNLPENKILHGKEVMNLDSIPVPDYGDYTRQKEKFSSPGAPVKKDFVLPFETSRGCWYGKCFFCGLNGKKNLYRTKSPRLIVKNIKALLERHGMSFIAMTDNIMPHQYIDTLIPQLSTGMPEAKIYYQMRADVTLDQVLALKKAGITGFQVGIESLSASLLKQMNKLYTARVNITILRYSRSAGIDLEWGFLFGFPGDQKEEYEEMLKLLPLLRHLQPPLVMIPLMLSRFSQYQRSPGSFGISGLRPAEVFKDIFPDHVHLEKIAYYFTGEYQSRSRENPALISALWEEYQAWLSAWSAYRTIPLEGLLPALQVIQKGEDRYVLEDTRGLPQQPKQREINRRQASLLLAARPREDVTGNEIQWAVKAGLGVMIDSWFVPLATAKPELLQEFERVP